MVFERALSEVIKIAARLAGKAEAEIEALCEPEIHALLAKLGYARQDTGDQASIVEPAPSQSDVPAEPTETDEVVG